MCSDDLAISVKNLGKCYQIYDSPNDRLKQFVLPRIRRFLGLKTRAYHGNFWAVKDLTFEIKKGEAVGIIGRNGSGKSTLLQMICGTLTPSNGSVRVVGRIAALLELGSGFNPEFTGRENVYMNASVLGLTNQEIDAKFSEIAEFADIGEFIERPIKTYSSGMMVRLAFAVIAHVDADILVIDEALAVGDVFFTQKCMRFLRAFMASGTVVFVSHDSAAVVNLCQRALWLHDGSLQMVGTPDQVSNAYLAARYGAVVELPEIEVHRQLSVELDEQLEVQTDRWNTQTRQAGFGNLICGFKFDSSGRSFGLGGAVVKNVELLNAHGDRLPSTIGGDYVSLRILIDCQRDIDQPIIGFFVKDRLGQVLFGENTFVQYRNSNLKFHNGNQINATFSFRMPILPAGSYALDVAIASGDDLNHDQIEWRHDVMVIESISSSSSTGLVGVPMQSISISGYTPN